MVYNNRIFIANEQNYYENICAFIRFEALSHINTKGYFTFVISGGKSPKYIFSILSSNKFTDIDWSKVCFYWVDERVIPPISIENNYKLAHEYLFSKLNQKTNFFKINVDSDINSSIINYETLIDNNVKDRYNGLPSFDLLLLGMGEDGHIASIFPDTPSFLSDKLVFSSGMIHSGFIRISLGFPLINNTKKIILLVNNRIKKNILYNYHLLLPVHKINLFRTTIFIHEKRDQKS